MEREGPQGALPLSRVLALAPKTGTSRATSHKGRLHVAQPTWAVALPLSQRVMPRLRLHVRLVVTGSAAALSIFPSQEKHASVAHGFKCAQKGCGNAVL